MTIAISLKVNDGVVLAADSASTLIGETPTGPSVVQVFNNANKVFNLRKGLPVGLITWGAGSLGKAAISTLVKDLRARFTSPDAAHKEWHLDPEAYTIEGVAELVRRFLFEENYQLAFASWKDKPLFGVIVAGYSPGASLADEYRLDINNKGECTPVTRVRKTDECGVTWSGEPEAISRLVFGFSPRMANVLQEKLGVPKDQIPKAMQVLAQNLSAMVVYDAMPIQDAIDLSEFLVDVTERFSRYTPGAATVGGPIEVAAITKHEGFKWVRRKHYYSSEFNVEDR